MTPQRRKRRKPANSDWTVDAFSRLVSVLLHGLLILALFLIKVPPAQRPPREFQVHFSLAPVTPQSPIRLVFLKPKQKPAEKPEPKRRAVRRRQRRIVLARRLPTPVQPVPLTPALRTRPAPPAAHPKPNHHGMDPHALIASLRNLEIVPRTQEALAASQIHPRFPDPTDLPHVLADVRSPSINLPDGMRQDKQTPVRNTREISHGVPMQDLPRHIDDRRNGAGNSHNAAEAGPKMAVLDRRTGMGLDSFTPTFHSAGGGPTDKAGASDPSPGEGGIPDLAHIADRLGSAEKSNETGGGPLGFHGPSSHPRPGLEPVLTAPNSDWKVAMAGGPSGSLGPGRGGRSGRGGGGIGGPDSPEGAFSMRPGHGGGAGEGAGGGLGGGIGRGVGRGFGAGVGGADGRGGGRGGAGIGSTFGAGYGHGKPGTLGNGLPEGVGEGGGGGRSGPFHRGGGGAPRPASDAPGENLVAFTIGCVLTNQDPPFNAAYLHERSMTELLYEVARATHIKVRVPRSDPDSYVNLVDGNINDVRRFTYNDIKGYPMIFLTGDQYFTISNEEKAALKRYVMADGGTIYGEDCHDPVTKGRSGFHPAFHRYMAETFGKQMEAIPTNDLLYHIKFDFNVPPAGDMGETAPFEGIKINGRWAVIYTINDYGDVWSPIHHYYPASRRPPALRIGANLYLYALTHFLDFHRQLASLN